MYTLLYRNKYGTFNFMPFIESLEEAKALYLRLVWWGCKAVRLDCDIATLESRTIWETPEEVIHSLENQNPSEELPF